MNVDNVVFDLCTNWPAKLEQFFGTDALQWYFAVRYFEWRT